MEYETTETAGKEGYPDALGMWESVFPDSADFKKKCPWYYESKSYASSLYLLREKGLTDVVGAISSVSRPYYLKNGEQVVGLCADFAVEKNHQTLVPALQILKSLVDGSHGKCDLLLGFPNNNAVTVMCRAGFHILDELPRYALVLKSEPYIKRITSSRFSSLVTVPLDFLLRLYFRLSRCSYFSDYQLTEIFSADDSFDILWNTYTEQSHLYTGKRDRAYLDWRFFSTPYSGFRVFSLKNKKTQVLVGYAVIRDNGDGNWYVFDFFTLPGSKILKCLMQKLIAVAIKENATSLFTEFLGNQEVTKLFHAMRFSKRTSERCIILYSLNESNEEQDDLYGSNNWYITSADELG